MATNPAAPMSWRDAILRIIMELGRETFTLQDIYGQSDKLASWFPTNLNIEPKIRQQLQYLRDEGVVDFLDNRGSYRLRRFVRGVD